jgi:hypothetical protein
MDPVTLYAPDGRSVTVRQPREATNLRMSGYRDEPPRQVTVEAPDSPDTLEVFDPSAHTVEQVQAFVAAHPQGAEQVLAAERAGQNRKGITG